MDKLINLVKSSQSWAVIGVNTDTEKYGYKIYKRLKELNKTVYGISPKYNELDGDKLYKNLKEIKDPIDIAVFVVNPHIGLQLVEDIKNKEIQTVWLQPGTTSEELIQTLELEHIKYIDACILVVSKAI